MRRPLHAITRVSAGKSVVEKSFRSARHPERDPVSAQALGPELPFLSKDVTIAWVHMSGNRSERYGSLPGKRMNQVMRHGGRLVRASAWLMIAAAVALLPGCPLAASGSICPAPLIEQQRFGFVSTLPGWPEQFDIDRLNAGWYVDFTRTEPVPAGLLRALVIRVSPGYTINPSRLGRLVEKSPGAIWLIGNEPDCIWQDSVLPEEYARIYHNLYVFIKDRDATSQIAAGGIVQPTPLRLQYLNRRPLHPRHMGSLHLHLINHLNLSLSPLGESLRLMNPLIKKRMNLLPSSQFLP